MTVRMAPDEKSSRYKIASGTLTLDGTAETSVETGLSVIVTAFACLKLAVTPGDATSVVTVDYAANDGQLDIWPWKNTSGTDPTLVASDGTEEVEWIAIGY